MPHFAMLTLLLAALVATPAAADKRDRDGGIGYERQDRAERSSKRADKPRKYKRRYAQRRPPYAYPWTPWWGPFPGPPGL